MPRSVVTLAPVSTFGFRATAGLSEYSCPGATYDAQRQALLRSSRGQGRFSAFGIAAGSFSGLAVPPPLFTFPRGVFANS